MKKCDKATYLDLVTNAMEAIKTLIFQLCLASRIPRDRLEAGDYLLVETKLWGALAILRLRRDQLLEDNRQLEHLNQASVSNGAVDSLPNI
jgi:hypothetical protein